MTDQRYNKTRKIHWISPERVTQTNSFLFGLWQAFSKNGNTPRNNWYLQMIVGYNKSYKGVVCRDEKALMFYPRPRPPRIILLGGWQDHNSDARFLILIYTIVLTPHISISMSSDTPTHTYPTDARTYIQRRQTLTPPPPPAGSQLR